MANPWDVLPFDPKRDADAETVYRAVGHALSGWELIVEKRVSCGLRADRRGGPLSSISGDCRIWNHRVFSPRVISGKA
jgi:hypothetical protein